jgi:hypothetical protein
VILLAVQVQDKLDGGRKDGQGLAGSGEQSEFLLRVGIAQFGNQARFQPADQTIATRPGLHGDAPARGVVPVCGGYRECPESHFTSLLRGSGGRGDSAGSSSGSLPPSFQRAAESLASVCGKAKRKTRLVHTHAVIPLG